jgi:hypothetical protein
MEDDNRNMSSRVGSMAASFTTDIQALRQEVTAAQQAVKAEPQAVRVEPPPRPPGLPESPPLAAGAASDLPPPVHSQPQEKKRPRD